MRNVSRHVPSRRVEARSASDRYEAMSALDTELPFVLLAVLAASVAIVLRRVRLRSE